MFFNTLKAPDSSRGAKVQAKGFAATSTSPAYDVQQDIAEHAVAQFTVVI